MRQPQEVEGLQTKMRWRRNVKSSLLIMDFFFFCEEFIVSDERTCVYRVSSNASLMCWRAFFNKSLKEQRPKKFDLCQKGTDTNSFGINMAL